MPAVKSRGRLYDQAAEFDAALKARQTAAADQMLAAWTDSYWRMRTELDAVLAKMAAAREAGEILSPAWAYQQGRLKGLLDTAKREIDQYAKAASVTAKQAQSAAVRAGEVHATRLAQQAVEESLGIEASMERPDPTALIRQAVGFTGDGTVLAQHLSKTLAPEVVDGIRSTLIKGLALGKGQDWLVREVTRNYALAHTRAVTIMRTETQRVYREVSRQTYAANSDVLEGWVWNAHLDAACCLGCALMDGTLHTVEETLDGHPRCRCAMIPHTKSWEDLGVTGLADSRPITPSGRDWVQDQTPAVQRALMGPAKYDAWRKGEISLDDMVGRHHSDDWGSMRSERSLVAIREGRNPNPTPRYVAEPPPPPLPAFEPDYVDTLTRQLINGPLTPAGVRQAMENASALGKANATEALARHSRHLIEAASRDAAEQAARLVPDDVLALFKPTKWTSSKRDRTLEALGRTPEGQRLAKLITKFQSESARSIPLLRTDIEKVLAGRGDELAASRLADIETLLDAVNSAKVDNKILHRGMSIPTSAERVLEMFKAGETMDISLGSFTSDRYVAGRFANGGTYGKAVKASARKTPVRIEWVGEGKRALPIQNTAYNPTIAGEREYLASGKFIIESVKKLPDGTVVVKVRRVGRLGA